MLRLSSSEEGDGESTDEPPQYAQYEKPVEVITRVVAKLNLEWPAKKQAEPSKSKLDEHFLRSSLHARACRFSPISILRFREHGQDRIRPASLVPLSLTTVTSLD